MKDSFNVSDRRGSFSQGKEAELLTDFALLESDGPVGFNLEGLADRCSLSVDHGDLNLGRERT